jgi:hypothetical protein
MLRIALDRTTPRAIIAAFAAIVAALAITGLALTTGGHAGSSAHDTWTAKPGHTVAATWTKAHAAPQSVSWG